MTRKSLLHLLAFVAIFALGALMSTIAFKTRKKEEAYSYQQRTSSTPSPSPPKMDDSPEKFHIALETYSGCSGILSEEELSYMAKRELRGLGDVVLSSAKAEYKIRLEVVAGHSDYVSLSFQARETCDCVSGCLGEKLVYRNMEVVPIAFAKTTVERFVAQFDGAALEWKRKPQT